MTTSAGQKQRATRSVLKRLAELRFLVALILFQMLCTLFFIFDVVEDFNEGDALLLHLVPEVAATLGLILGIIFEIIALRYFLGREADMRRGLSVAAGALADVMEGYFQTWGLTPAESDVARFTIKGFSIAEIAELRGSAEGTIKTHLNAIYRKSGVAGRAQLVSLLVEDLLNAPLVAGGAVPGDASAHRQEAADDAKSAVG